MSRFVAFLVLPVTVLALAGCQEAPVTPNVASYSNSNYATSGVCGALGDCPSNSTPFPMMDNPPGGM